MDPKLIIEDLIDRLAPRLGTERAGTRFRVPLPSEIAGLIPPARAAQEVGIEEMDFFDVPANRRAILQREGGRCFYCLRAVDDQNHVVEHVVSRQTGSLRR